MRYCYDTLFLIPPTLLIRRYRVDKLTRGILQCCNPRKLSGIMVVREKRDGQAKELVSMFPGVCFTPVCFLQVYKTKFRTLDSCLRYHRRKDSQHLRPSRGIRAA